MVITIIWAVLTGIVAATAPNMLFAIPAALGALLGLWSVHFYGKKVFEDE